MKVLLTSLALLMTCLQSAWSQDITIQQVDTLVEKVIRTFDVPGIAVAVVKDGRVLLAKGYGVRSLTTKKKVDEHTLFGIASNSKAFTTAAIGMLVDEGKLHWDDKVRTYIPEFKLYDPYVTEEFTIRDLLTHRSGLGLGAGDLMMFPDSNNFTRQDIIYNLRYLKPASSFRTKYDYDNNLYIVAGEVIEKVSGLHWEDFIEKRIMQPLGMQESAASIFRLKDKTNLVSPHAPVDGKVIPISIDWSETANAAGGICSNLTDMSKWVIMQLNHGRYGDSLSQHLFSGEAQDEMWAPQTIIDVRGPSAYNTHFSAYGLGWFLSDVKGYKQVSHTGGLAGVVTQVTLLPELKLGIIVLTNQQSGAAFTAITNTIKDVYLGVKGIDRVEQMHARVAAFEQDAHKLVDSVWAIVHAQKAFASDMLASYAGTFNDKWFGDVDISLQHGSLWFASRRSLKMRGQMFPLKGNTFVVKWNDRSMDADAYVEYVLDRAGNASAFRMHAISPMTDFSFDFQDLDFTRK